MKVNILRNYDYPDLMRQTPNNSGLWGSLKFTAGSVSDSDYLVVLNKPNEDIKINCRIGCRWLIIQEPPYQQNDYLKKYFKHFDKIFTQIDDPAFINIIHSQTSLPWHVDKSYDDLTSLSEQNLSEKENKISWITSTKKIHPIHFERLAFMDFIKQSDLEIDLFGRGIQPIENKFDGLFPYKYTLSVENYCGDNYWTEKIADAFLCWTMPIYYGCTNICDYFPERSIIKIDINKPQEALEIINKAITDQVWDENLLAIKKARDLVLNKYQIFPFLSEQIRKDIENRSISERIKKQYFIPELETELVDKIKSYVTSAIKRLL